jgi:ribosome-binding factor A
MDDGGIKDYEICTVFVIAIRTHDYAIAAAKSASGFSESQLSRTVAISP